MTHEILAPENAAQFRRPGPGSMVWEHLADDRMLLLGGATLVVQVAHPTVGAGVAEHSNFKAEPWRRLTGTLVSLTKIVYGTDATAAAEVIRLRSMHRTIKGVDDAGHSYSALRPGPWAWVHGTLAWHVIRANELFRTAFTVDEAQQYWAEWLEVGRLLGVRDGDLPATFAEFERFLAVSARTTLRDNVSVRDVVVAISSIPAPSWLRWTGAVWELTVGRPAGHLARLVTIGALPAELRELLGLQLSPAEARRLRRLTGLVAFLRRLAPPPLRPGPAALYIRWLSRRHWDRGAPDSVGRHE